MGSAVSRVTTLDVIFAISIEMRREEGKNQDVVIWIKIDCIT